MGAKIFDTITLHDGRLYSIAEIVPSHIWRAHQRHNKNNPEEYDVLPFILEQIVLIENKRIDIEELNTLHMKDYTSICDVVNVILKDFEI